MLNFDFLEKGLGVVSSPHVVHEFLRTCFSYFILLTGHIWLPDLFYLLRYAICILQLFVSQVVALWIIYLTNQAVILLEQKVKTET